jgi:hypothetical protein
MRDAIFLVTQTRTGGADMSFALGMPSTGKQLSIILLGHSIRERPARAGVAPIRSIDKRNRHATTIIGEQKTKHPKIKMKKAGHRRPAFVLRSKAVMGES